MADATARDLGELGLIAAVTARLPGGAHVPVGPGDDAAVVTAPDGRVVATVDVLVEGVHFRRDWSTGYDVGRKAAAANLADVAAMGATGTALLVGLSAPGDLPVDWALALADGLRDEAALVGAAVVGGDTVRGDAVVVSVTALGDLAGVEPVRRSGARPGDLLVVAGDLGSSALGLRLLGSDRTEGSGAAAARAVALHRRPEPPYALGPALARLGATAMCDVSDGLVADALSLAVAGGVVLVLDEPGTMQDHGDLRALLGDAVVDDAVLHGGEGHALLATVPADRVDAVVSLGARVVGRVEAVGQDGPGVVRGADGGALAARGWEHFG